MIYKAMMAFLMMPLGECWVTNFLAKTTAMLIDKDDDDDNDYDGRC
jgi:hypothetical protein